MKDRYKLVNHKRRYLCHVDECDNFAYAEMFRISSGDLGNGWQYVCHKHYSTARKRNEGDVIFCILEKPKKNLESLVESR